VTPRDLVCSRCGETNRALAASHGDRCRVCGGILKLTANRGVGDIDVHESREGMYSILSAQEGQDHD